MHGKIFWQQIWQRIFGNSNINVREKFLGFRISREKVVIYEMILSEN